MLIIPFENKINWRNPPIVTTFLILVNCLVFFMYQLGDDRRMQVASVVFIDKGIYEFEKDLFPDYVAQNTSGDYEDIDTTEEIFIFQSIMRDLKFGAYVKNYWKENPDKEDQFWVVARKRFEDARDQISSFRFGFIPANHDPVTLFTHMFLHGGVGHLLGNMVFLFIFGFALEVIIGRVKFLLLYLLSGLCAVYMHMAVDPGSYIQLVGASGAISGLMGMYLAAYGIRKIRFFYTVGFYFGQFSAPAILIFPYWIGKEIYSQFTVESNVAYMAHAGGLLGGFVIVYALKLLGMVQVKFDVLEEEKKDDNLEEKLDRISELFSTLETDRARDLCKKTVVEYPLSTKVWEKYYNLWKAEPNSKGFHEVTFNIFKLSRKKGFDMDFVAKILDSYLRIAPKPVALNGPVCAMLGHCFITSGHPNYVEMMVNRTMKLGFKDESVSRLLIYLARHFERIDDKPKALRYRKTLKENYPTVATNTKSAE